MRKSRLSWEQQERLIEHFVAGTTARTAATLETRTRRRRLSISIACGS
jgi:transposase-like protein